MAGSIFRFGTPLYPITDRRNCRGWTHRRLAECYVESGIRFFQVREKDRSDAALLHELLQVRRLCDRSGACFVVNDRVDLALACHADGVHLGQEDLPVEAARELLGRDAIIGLSTHNTEQFQRALRQDVDYIALGPIFATLTKSNTASVVGVEEFRRLARLSSRPVVAIGGIRLESAPLLWQAGAAAVAVISDINQSPEPGEQIQAYLRLAKEVMA